VLTEAQPARPTRVGHVLKDPWDLSIGRDMLVRGYRASPWANPHSMEGGVTREGTIRRYARTLAGRPDLLRQLPALRGLTLGCWCHTVDWRQDASPLSLRLGADVPCHGDCLAWLVDHLPASCAGDDVVVAARRLLHGWPDACPGQVDALRRGMGRDPTRDLHRPPSQRKGGDAR
jgi:hypothetical protein